VILIQMISSIIATPALLSRSGRHRRRRYRIRLAGAAAVMFWHMVASSS
jgi:hypothetical protein